jgi:hypothetical protein
MNSPSIEPADIPASADVGIEPTVEPNKPSSPVNQKAWYDIEYGCYILEDPLPPLERDDLAPAVAQDNHPSLGLSQDASNPYSDGNAQCTSQEPGADALHQPRRKDSEHDSGESVSELEKDLLKAFKEQDDLSSANISNPPHSHHSSPEPACLQLDQEPDQSVPEVLRDASQLRAQLPTETDVIPIFLGHQPQEKAAGEARDVEDGSSEPEQTEPAEKRTYEGQVENISSQTQSPECRASSHIINSEEDEEDEEPRPAKRRKRNSQLTRHTPIHVEQHISQTSRSPSALESQCLSRSIKSGPSKAFSNAQGSGMRQRTISSSNCRVRQSSSAYQLKHAMRKVRQQRVLRHLIPKSPVQLLDPGQGSGGRGKMIQD